MTVRTPKWKSLRQLNVVRNPFRTARGTSLSLSWQVLKKWNVTFRSPVSSEGWNFVIRSSVSVEVKRVVLCYRNVYVCIIKSAWIYWTANCSCGFSELVLFIVEDVSIVIENINELVLSACFSKISLTSANIVNSHEYCVFLNTILVLEQRYRILLYILLAIVGYRSEVLFL